jgi:hypothetical protein
MNQQPQQKNNLPPFTIGFDPAFINLPVCVVIERASPNEVVIFSQCQVVIDAFNCYKKQLKKKPRSDYRRIELETLDELIRQFNYAIQEHLSESARLLHKAEYAINLPKP